MAIWRKRLAYGAILMAVALHGAEARVVRIIIDKTEPGQSAVGPTVAITGHAIGELDPRAPGNAIITDIDHAPVNARGMVEYVAKFTITKPADMTKASGVRWYDRSTVAPPFHPIAAPPTRSTADMSA